jgi:RNase P/RNase MRP subunit p30
MKDINLFRIKNSVYLAEVSSKADLENLGDCDGILIGSSEKEARRIIASLKDRRKAEGGKPFLIAIVGGDDAFNRRVIETLKIDYLVSPEAERPKVAGVSGCRGVGVSDELKTKRKRDTLKQRDSGLNHVVARMAGEKGVGIVVDFGDIARLKGKEKAGRIARAMQNVKVCRKVGCSLKIASFGKSKKGVVDVKGRESFGFGLGMSSKEVSDCARF